MSGFNKICCADCGKHLLTEEKEKISGRIKCVEGSYENGYYDGEKDVFYCKRCAKKHGLEYLDKKNCEYADKN